MDKMQKLESVNEKIRALKKDSVVLGELCLRIQEYVNEERFLPTELYERSLYHLDNMKNMQDICREGYTGLTGVSDLPDTYAEAERRMKKQYEFFCKEEIVQNAVRFKRLVTDNPLEADALREAQDKTEIVDPSTLTLDRCRERYQPYIDFMEAFEENNAEKRISYVRKLENNFTPELIAGVIITRDIYDPYEEEEDFDEMDLDDYDSGSEDIAAVQTYLPDEYSDENDPDIDELEETAFEEAALKEAAEASLMEAEAAEEDSYEASADVAEAAGEDSYETSPEVAEAAGEDSCEASPEVAEAAGEDSYEDSPEVAEAAEEDSYEASPEKTEAAEEVSEEEAEVEAAIEEATEIKEDACEEVTENGEQADEEPAVIPPADVPSAEEAPERTAEEKDYLEDFDKEYVKYYRMAAERAGISGDGRLAPWPKPGETFGKDGLINVLNSLGFSVKSVEEQDQIRGKYENYNVVLDGADRNLTGSEPWQLANFLRNACEDGFRVVCLYGNFSGEGFSRAFREIGNRHHTLILFEESVTQGVRRSLVRLVRKEGQIKEFALLDRAAYTYLEQNYETDKINKMFFDIVMPGPATK